MEESFCSTRQFRDFYMTPGDDELLDIIGYMHEKGIRVMLRPMLECWDGTQRYQIHLPEGAIFPDRPYHYRTQWFANYEHLTRHYCRIASRTGCEGYCLDSELNQLATASQDWLKIVDAVRNSFKGHLTSSFIRVEQFLPQMEADSNFWFYALDSIGSSHYYPTSANGGGTVEDMVAYLQPTVQKIAAFAKAYGKPYYFGETGCAAMINASRRPASWLDDPMHPGYDGQEQANYIEAIIRSYAAQPWWHGFFLWKWDEHNYREQFHNDPAGDKGFTIYGKPAAQVLKRWCDNDI
ncbi:MAG: hypothetical protein IKP00_04400 [Victivallales bacterium]|nr:hypothetical protein [Victivallales bacterium]